ncbi:thioredoxin fold domain-containing protein [Vibrio sp. S11_S32]|uniref:thioredoxin fold domain-containing protein n=1 Tax=Vibrio sp. S11_S32 TaxID=2720225 RepID=UPI00168021DE|nr:thioredoxin fold domain-containing protein [Vibrio sp. S11_S32]MBD1577088.1 thioredoxin fold domain-containing protein [Vibrio sp. S11_S32]
MNLKVTLLLAACITASFTTNVMANPNSTVNSHNEVHKKESSVEYGELTQVMQDFGQYAFTMSKPNATVGIVVFYDLNCPYCNQFLATSVPILVDHGVSVSLLPYPKDGLDSATASQMVDAWKWRNPIAKAKYPQIPNQIVRNFTKEDLIKIYDFADKEAHVNGTPFTLLPTGESVSGAFKAEDLIKYFDSIK